MKAMLLCETVRLAHRPKIHLMINRVATGGNCLDIDLQQSRILYFCFQGNASPLPARSMPFPRSMAPIMTMLAAFADPACPRFPRRGCNRPGLAGLENLPAVRGRCKG